MEKVIVKHWDLQSYELVETTKYTDGDGGTWAIFKVQDSYSSPYAVGKINRYAAIENEIRETNFATLKDARSGAYRLSQEETQWQAEEKATYLKKQAELESSLY